MAKSPIKCANCSDQGWVVEEATGITKRCPRCTDWLAHSRLTDEERNHTIDDLKNRPDDRERGEMYVLRFLAKEMLNESYGFLSIYGHKGGGKSLLLTALVASFCRQRVNAVYFNSGDIVTMLSAGEENEIDGFRVAGNFEVAKRRLKGLPVLAIDEMDKIRWTDWQIQQIGEVIEHRHRHADRLVTLFAMNYPPLKWHEKVGEKVEHIASRLADGRFHRQWPANVKVPGCLKGSRDVPGFFEVTLPDIRPTLRRF